MSFSTDDRDREPRDSSRAMNDPHGEAPELADRLWSEFGWALSGSTVAAMVGAILVVSCIVRLFH